MPNASSAQAQFASNKDHQGKRYAGSVPKKIGGATEGLLAKKLTLRPVIAANGWRDGPGVGYVGERQWDWHCTKDFSTVLENSTHPGINEKRWSNTERN
jgi:hypothetical protein